MAPIPGSTYLFFFAHPDDDVMIAGTLRGLIEENSVVHACWATSGGFMGGAGRREAELKRVAQVVGLQWTNVHLLRYPDARLTSELADLVRSVSTLISDMTPDVMVVDAFEGGHPDHDCVNFAAYEALRRTGRPARLFEFPIYNGSGPAHHWWWRINGFPPGGGPVSYNPLSKEQIRVKHRTMKIYRSQWFYMVPARIATSADRMAVRGEPYRECPVDRDHTVRPHSGRLTYERWFSAFLKTTFEEYARAVESVRACCGFPGRT